jgi:hypothetical protein
MEYIYGIWLENKIKNKKLCKNENCENRDEKIIVSMASYRNRYNNIIISLKSLILQSVKPDKIIVWLDDETEENKITNEMKLLEDYGVEYRYTEGGLKAHKKYFYVMQEFSEACIITVDDDLIYSRNMIKSLLKYHEMYPDEICARRVHKMTFDSHNKIKSYVDWEYECRTQRNPSFRLFATGGAGTLYPPNSLPKETYDIISIKSMCLNADDIWLKFMELLNHKKVVWVKNNYVMPKEIENSQKQALNYSNVLLGENDKYIAQLCDKYKDILNLLMSELD